VSRPYRTGSRWAFWRWTVTDSGYLTRLHLVKTPWFAVCLHWIHKPDPEPYLHDHPVSFVSVVLRGWYHEVRSYPVLRYHNDKDLSWVSVEQVQRRVSRLNTVRASTDDVHSITAVSPGGCLTLCFMGPKHREWGFHTPTGWIMWKDYYRAKQLASVSRT